jgi:cell division protein FtsI/penicillin-binding protein 2
VLDAGTGVVLASAGVSRRGVPGSAIKPLLLAYALQHDIVRPEMEVYCQRNLHVGGLPLPCMHPADLPVFTAESALAESCNTWFAEMARRFSGPELEAALVTASPLQLAQAYREMLQRLPPHGPVAKGLEGSVVYGMASPAAVSGETILGKTGTASEPGESWTHGWFAGAIPGRLVIVIYVPHGDGGTAAGLAQQFFRTVFSIGSAR